MHSQAEQSIPESLESSKAKHSVDVEHSNDFQKSDERGGRAPNEVNISTDKSESDFPVSAPEFQAHLNLVKQLLLDRHYQEAIEYLHESLDKHRGQQHVEDLRMLSIILFKIKDFERAEQSLKKAIDYLDKISGLAGASDCRKNIYLNLAIVQLESCKHSEALELLDDPVFNLPTADLPFSYYSLIGDALTGLSKPQDAYQNYLQHINRILKDAISEFSLSALLMTINKAANCLSETNNPAEFSSFLSWLIGKLGALSSLQELLPADASPLLQKSVGAVVETALFNILSLLLMRRDSELQLVVVRQVVDKKCLNIDRYSAEEATNLGQNLLQIALKMQKGEDAGLGTEQFRGAIQLARALLARGDLRDPKTFKMILVCYFNQAIFHIEQAEFPAAQKLFEECLQIYENNSQTPNSDLFVMLFNIGQSLVAADKSEQAEFYFEKINKLAPESEPLREQSLKILAKQFFRKGDYQRCKAV